MARLAWVSVVVVALMITDVLSGSFGVGDAIGWLAVITVFVLLWSLIIWILRKSRSIGLPSVDGYTALMDKIVALDKKIEMLEKDLKEVKEQREELKRMAQREVLLRKELETVDMPSLYSGSPLLAVIGDNSELEFDLASLRAVESETGLEFRRIKNASLLKMKQSIDRARANRRQFDKIHMSVHSNKDGIYLGDELVDGEALSEILQGVKILLIAGCESSYVGDFLGVVPYVITITERVQASDASMFARAFWTQIGKKMGPNEALKEALRLAPSSMNEYVENHW